MSNKQNDVYFEDKKEEFYIALSDHDWEKCKKIIEEMREISIETAHRLIAEMETEREIQKAWEEGSEKGVDKWQDKI